MFSYASWLAAIVLVALGSIKSDINKRKRLKESKEELSSREPTQHMSLSIFSVLNCVMKINQANSINIFLISRKYLHILPSLFEHYKTQICSEIKIEYNKLNWQTGRYINHPSSTEISTYGDLPHSPWDCQKHPNSHSQT